MRLATRGIIKKNQGPHMETSADGWVRLSLEELLSLPLRHLLSGIDDASEERANKCGEITSISGYTEWLSTSQPVITLGWDVMREVGVAGLSWVRAGLPRTNVRLINPDGTDMEWNKNLHVLATVVDALPWQQEISLALAEKYAVKPSGENSAAS